MVIQSLTGDDITTAFPPKPSTRYPITPLTIARLLLLTDILGLLSCMILFYIVRPFQLLEGQASGLSIPQFWSWSSVPILGVMVIYLLGLYLADTYRLAGRESAVWMIIRVLSSLGITLSLTASLTYLLGEPIPRRLLLAGISLFAAWAIATRLVALKFLRRTQGRSCWLILGNGSSTERFEQDYLRSYHDAKVFRLAEAPVEKKHGLATGSPTQIVGILDELEVWCDQNWSGVIIEDPTQHLSDDVIKALMRMRLRGIYIYSLENYYEQAWSRIPPTLIKDDWFAFTGGFSLFHNRINVKLKRGLDILLTGIALIFLLPLMLVVAIAIKLDSKGPIFYSQIRTGLNGKPFRVHKFRSMYTDAEKQGAQWCRTTDDRITRVGKIIRRLNIDELPQLLNVLQGDMSLIGPRPERPEFDCQLEQEIPYYNIRYLVRPGITGWYQVNYPYAASVEDAHYKVSYDLYYIKNYSLLLDLAIVFKTLRVVVLGRKHSHKKSR